MIKIKILTVIFLFLFVNSSFAQEKWINYTSMKSVNRIAFEENRLWAATTGGVLSWNIENGSFEKYTTAEGLSHNFVRTVAVDSERNKWFATEAGIAIFDEIQWTTFTVQDGLANNRVEAIAFDPNGDMWIGTWGVSGQRREAIAAVPDEMLLAAYLIGTEEMVRARLRAFRDAGVDVLRLSSLGRSSKDRIAHLERCLDLIASECG